MKSVGFSAKDGILILVLALIVIGAVYYLTFFSPLQNELNDIQIQCGSIDSQISSATAKLSSMNAMQTELDEIFARPENEITEIAPYDNAKTVMNFLNGILSRSNEYRLASPDPKIDQDGMVRRSVSLSFTCDDYETAKSILNDLSGWNYRCLIQSLSVTQDTTTAEERFYGIRTNPVSVSASMTFFESKKIE